MSDRGERFRIFAPYLWAKKDPDSYLDHSVIHKLTLPRIVDDDLDAIAYFRDRLVQQIRQKAAEGLWDEPLAEGGRRR